MSEQASKSTFSSFNWLGGIPLAILAVIELIEPPLFEDEKYTLWRMIRVCVLAMLFLFLSWSLKKRHT